MQYLLHVLLYCQRKSYATCFTSKKTPFYPKWCFLKVTFRMYFLKNLDPWLHFTNSIPTCTVFCIFLTLSYHLLAIFISHIVMTNCNTNNIKLKMLLAVTSTIIGGPNSEWVLIPMMGLFTVKCH